MTTDVFLYAPTGEIGAHISDSTHFHAKKVSVLGGSWPMGEMKENTSRSASRVKTRGSAISLPFKRLEAGRAPVA